ncbi:MAG TPA: CsbD family protein [Alphaproteobacteria bacterium]|nr:CsbD family protein [Alphaproteobacteria bacterium]
MNWDQIEGQWQRYRGRVKEQWGHLTDDELDVIAGNRDQLVGKIQEKHGLSKEEAERQLEEWQKYVKI